MKMNNRFIYGILSIVLAALIAFIGIPAVTHSTNGTVEIVRMKNAVSRGTLITASDLELVTVGSYNLPENAAKRTEDVAGTYAATDLYPGDYILPQKVSSTPLSSDPALDELPDGMVAISITIEHLANGLSDKLQRGDIIRIFHYDTDNVLDAVVDIPQLRYVKVLAVSDPDGLDIDYTVPPAEDEERQNTATVTVLASPEQALLLTLYENTGSLHIALISRGNEKLAKELLERQDNILNQLYGDTDPSDASPDSIIPLIPGITTPTEDGETENSTGAAEEFQPGMTEGGTTDV